MQFPNNFNPIWYPQINPQSQEPIKKDSDENYLPDQPIPEDLEQKFDKQAAEFIQKNKVIQEERQIVEEEILSDDSEEESLYDFEFLGTSKQIKKEIEEFKKKYYNLPPSARADLINKVKETYTDHAADILLNIIKNGTESKSLYVAVTAGTVASAVAGGPLAAVLAVGTGLASIGFSLYRQFKQATETHPLFHRDDVYNEKFKEKFPESLKEAQEANEKLKASLIDLKKAPQILKAQKILSYVTDAGEVIIPSNLEEARKAYRIIRLNPHRKVNPLTEEILKEEKITLLVPESKFCVLTAETLKEEKKLFDDLNKALRILRKHWAS